ncbi:MAG TPA: Do family serine endopeptidase, partial [candidate division Zixibacteria bacterium]|nr:Do family serine endopeptidase [candidate division Zixibacteria bacterium]
YRQTGLGSGVIISEDGYIVTNNHVVQDADTIYVQTSDGQRQTAKVIGTDPRTDIAVLRIDANGLRAIRLGNSDDIRVGEWVVAVGSPLSPNLAQTVTQGIVSAKGRSNVGLADYEDFIQTDAAINPGNSGGPLVNLDGELIGINTAIASQSGGYQGIGFAVPVNMVKYVMESLIQEGHVVRGWLGVSISDISPAMSRTLGLESTQGALVQEVVKGSPAEDAGLKEGDVILAIDGQTVQNSTELRNRIAEIRPGTRASLTVFHEGAKNQVWVKLVEMTAEAAAAGGPGSSLDETLGFQVAELTRDLAREYGVEGGAGGAVVIAVDSESSAYQAGLREGDVVRAVNRRQVRSVDELRSLLSGVGKGDDVLLRVQRQDRYFFIAFTL